jgi:hypothetical protein
LKKSRKYGLVAEFRGADLTCSHRKQIPGGLRQIINSSYRCRWQRMLRLVSEGTQFGEDTADVVTKKPYAPETILRIAFMEPGCFYKAVDTIGDCPPCFYVHLSRRWCLIGRSVIWCWI